MLAPVHRCPACKHAINRELPVDPWFDDEDMAVKVRGDLRRVQPLTWAVLVVLREHVGSTVASTALETVIAERSRPENVIQAVRLHIHRARRALQDTPYRISTVWETGYRLDRTGAASEAVAC